MKEHFSCSEKETKPDSLLGKRYKNTFGNRSGDLYKLRGLIFGKRINMNDTTNSAAKPSQMLTKREKKWELHFEINEKN